MYSAGVIPVCSLKALKKVEREENPESSATFSIVKSFVIPSLRRVCAYAIRLSVLSLVNVVSRYSLKQ